MRFRWKLILEHWDDILRFVASINTQHASASQLFKRLSSYARDHPLYQALKEFGRLIKTQFILSYFDDVELRQRIQKQLNRVELSNKFSKAVYFDNDQTFQDASLENQEITAACKLIIQNAVILWNYLYLSEQIALTKTREDKKALISDVIRGSVITWRHVNFRGEYDFSPAASKGRQFDLPTIKTLNINAISA